MRRLLSAGAVARTAGISYRQVDYWTRTGHINAEPREDGEGSGTPRLYSLRDARHVVVMATLNRCGMTVAAAAAAAHLVLDAETDYLTDVLGAALDDAVTVHLDADVEIREDDDPLDPLPPLDPDRAHDEARS